MKTHRHAESPVETVHAGAAERRFLARLPGRKGASGLFGVALLAGAAGVAAWPQSGSDREPPGRPANQVRAAVATTSTTTRGIAYPGVVRSARRATVSFSVAGRVVDRPVAVGDEVGRGQPIARLDGREYRLAERQARAGLAEIATRRAQADRDRARVEALHATRAATREELEQVVAASEALAAGQEAAEARLEEASRLAADSELLAPFDGVIAATHIEPGEWTAPGRPVAEIAGRGGLELEIEVPESIRGSLEAGSTVRIELPLARLERLGRIVRISSAAPGPGRLYEVAIALDEPAGLVPGQSAVAHLALPAEPGVEIPLAAVLNPGASRPSVFRVRGGRAERVWIAPGEIHDGRIVVREGLASGDSVVVAGHGTLVDGDRIEAAEDAEPEVR